MGEERIEYPDPHRQQIMDLIETLQGHFAASPDVYVSGNLLLLYEEGHPRKHVSPDVLVSFGIPKRMRENYLLWEEGKAPDFIAEITSKSTRLEDTGVKKGLYSALGVKEYVLFDPYQEYLLPPFKVYRLQAGDYVPVLIPTDAPAYRSDVLGLELRVEGGVLRLVNLETGRLLPTHRADGRTAARAGPRPRGIVFRGSCL